MGHASLQRHGLPPQRPLRLRALRDPLGPGRVQRHAAAAGAVLTLRREGREDHDGVVVARSRLARLAGGRAYGKTMLSRTTIEAPSMMQTSLSRIDCVIAEPRDIEHGKATLSRDTSTDRCFDLSILKKLARARRLQLVRRRRPAAHRSRFLARGHFEPMKRAADYPPTARLSPLPNPVRFRRHISR
jgi:hypothetical protein